MIGDDVEVQDQTSTWYFKFNFNIRRIGPKLLSSTDYGSFQLDLSGAILIIS
jgi:hypothetical protein